MVARVLEDITVAVHYLVMAYIVFGGFIAWPSRLRWTRYLHLGFIGWAVISLLFPVACPLTALQNTLRHAQGLPDLHNGFISTYITGVLYPASDVLVVQIVAGLIVITAWVGIFLRSPNRRTTRNRTARNHGDRNHGGQQHDVKPKPLDHAPVT